MTMDGPITLLCKMFRDGSTKFLIFSTIFNIITKHTWFSSGRSTETVCNSFLIAARCFDLSDGFDSIDFGITLDTLQV